MVNSISGAILAIQLTYGNHNKQNPLIPGCENVGFSESLFSSLFSEYTRNDVFKIITVSPRLLSCYQDFLGLLAEYNVTLYSRTKINPFSEKMTPETALNRKELLNNAL
jgi:hypothetical protein